MKTTTGTARTWGLATVAIAVILLVAAWFLLISPVMAEASETRAETERQEEQNEIARQEVAALRADYARIDEYQAYLAGLQEQITTTQRYADLQRLVASIADEHDVVVTLLAFGTAEEIEPPAPPVAPAPAATAEGEEAPAEDEDGAAEAPAAPPEPEMSGLFSIPVSIEFVGEYNDVLAAVGDLQEGVGRIVLITNVGLTADSSTENGADSTVATLEGQTFVLADVDAITAEEEAAAEELTGTDEEPTDEPSAAPSPLPQSSQNPLAPNES